MTSTHTRRPSSSQRSRWSWVLPLLRTDCSAVVRNASVIFAVACATRLYGAVLGFSVGSLWISGREMGFVGASLAAGHGFASPFGVPTGPTAFVMPGYPLLIAAIFKLFGTFTALSTWLVVLMQCAASALVIVPLLRLGKTLRGNTALIAAWIWALYPPLANEAGLRIWETTYSTLFLIVAVLLARRLRDDSPLRLWLGFGLLWGIATLFNAALVLVFGALAGSVVVLRRRDGRHILVRFAASFAVFTALLLPWMVRNQRALHAFVPLRTSFPLEFWIGNVYSQSGYFDMFGHPASNPVELDRYRQLGEVAYMSEKSHLALQHVRAAPLDFTVMTVRRFLRFWIGIGFDSGVYWAGFPIVLLAILGMLVMAPGERWLFAVPFAVYPAPYYLAHTEVRFRDVLEPLLLVLASFALVWIAERLRRSVATSQPMPSPGEEPVAAPNVAATPFSGPPPRTAVIIGAGPAGLTAAYELLTRTSIKPIVLEKSSFMGGISRTVHYKGNRIDIGGHRFFSKSERVMNWWLQHLPMAPGGDSSSKPGMLVRQRRSRIYFLRQFFEYPIRLSLDTLSKLGWWRDFRIGVSYLRASLLPIRRVRNLEQFFINRFGRELYHTFFKSYTEKVWGVPCTEISAEWGEQRIKGLSIRAAIAHFVKSLLRSRNRADLAQRQTETSLIEQFLYPKLGPGQMWETVAARVLELGGEIHTGCDVKRFELRHGRIAAAVVATPDGSQRTIAGDLFFSTMPVQELIRGLGEQVPANVRAVADGLVYRDFLTVGLLLRSLKVHDRKLIPDNWIYIQEPDVLAGRLQIFNNWSPHMVASSGTVWVGVEYFCREGDELWQKPEDELGQLATAELEKIGLIAGADVLDFTVIRMPKSYPAYFGTYDRFQEIRNYVDGIQNLFLLGRNGMHKYNNQDHSMLTAMVAVDNIAAGTYEKTNVWDVNTEQEYHEAKRETARRIETGKAAAATSQA